MQSYQPLGDGKNQGNLKPADTSERSETLGTKAVVEEPGSKGLSSATTQTATTAQPSTETLQPLDYPFLRLQASLMAGSVGEWLSTLGTRAKSETVLLTQPSGKPFKAIRIFLAIDDNDLEVVETPDGIDFAVNGERFRVVE